MRAILMFHNCEGQSHKTVSTDHNFLREKRAEADSTRGPSAYQLNAFTARPNRFTQGRKGKKREDSKQAPTRKTKDVVDRRQNNKNVKAVSPRH